MAKEKKKYYTYQLVMAGRECVISLGSLATVASGPYNPLITPSLSLWMWSSVAHYVKLYNEVVCPYS